MELYDPEKDMIVEVDLSEASDKTLVRSLYIFSYNKCGDEKNEAIMAEILRRLKERQEMLVEKRELREHSNLFYSGRVVGPFGATKEEAEIWSDPKRYIKD